MKRALKIIVVCELVGIVVFLGLACANADAPQLDHVGATITPSYDSDGIWLRDSADDPCDNDCYIQKIRGMLPVVRERLQAAGWNMEERPCGG